MSIPEGHRANFNNMLEAAKAGRVALVECTDKKTREPRYVICMVNTDPETTEIEMVPVGHMFEGDSPYDQYEPPRL